MALSTNWTIAGTPTHGGSGKWLVRDRNSKRPREVDEADIFEMPDCDEKIAKWEKTYKKTYSMHAIAPPPESWTIAANDIVQVDVQGVGFTPARVTKVFNDGWFKVSLKTSQWTRGWTDHLNYLEEGTEWIRTTSPLQIVPPTAAALGVATALETSTSRDDATTVIDDEWDAAEDDAQSMCPECRWLFDKEAADEPLLTSANDLMFVMVPRIQFCLKKLTENANSLNLQKALFECVY